ncbi:hypothetical protein AAZX31_09G150900 [Glycine max]
MEKGYLRRGAAGDGIKAWSSGSHFWVRSVMKVTMFLAGLAVLWLFLYNSISSFEFPTSSYYFNAESLSLESVLRNTSMKDKTVIITILNEAWAEPGSMFDLFLESFKSLGYIRPTTKRQMNTIVIITVFSRMRNCSQSHRNTTVTTIFKPIHTRQVQRAHDTDNMWLRDPFKIFYKDTDFQIACDVFNGNSSDLNNFPNGGFKYVKSNKRTIWFYKFWFKSRNVYPGLHQKMKLKMRLLSTSYFGGFCERAEDFNKVSTMHANCCVGLENKVNDLKLLLEDWNKYMALSENEKKQSHPSWSVPQLCRTSFERAKQRNQNN